MTTHDPIHPVILCGGSGTRLWPASRKQRPKPFLPLMGERTLFQQAIDRVSEDETFADPIVVAGEAHRELVQQQLADIRHRLVIEPAARNTAPAIALAAALLEPEAVMLVCPSDHHVADADAFRTAATNAAVLARGDRLVAFGITPDRPETGYGYIRRGEPLDPGFEVARFVEKPDDARAREYIESGEYSWNGGIFAFRAGVYLAELERHRPDIARGAIAAVEGARTDGALVLPEAAPFAAIEGESIDYAVMEATRRAAMVPADMGWSDIGTWPALHDALRVLDEAGAGADLEYGNVTRGPADLAECRGVLAMSDGPRISAVGLKDACIIVSDGEVLVTTRAHAQSVGKLPGARDQ